MALAGKQKKIFDGRYEILAIVGRGSRSFVYHARHAGEETREVAIKVLLNQKDGSSTREKMRKEALAMVSSHHRSVIRLDDFHSVGDLSYIAMEYAPEADLRKYLAKQPGKTLTPQHAEKFLRQAAEALDFVHLVGILHRDIKPDNILVISADELRLGDFGVALLPGDDSSPEDLRRAVGTLDYLAPEVIEGSGCDVRSDIYSLCVTFYESIAGVNPFANAPLAQQLERRRDQAIPALSHLVPGIPEGLAAIIMKGLRFDANERFQSVKELISALGNAEIISATTHTEPVAHQDQMTLAQEQQEAGSSAPSEQTQRSRKLTEMNVMGFGHPATGASNVGSHIKEEVASEVAPLAIVPQAVRSPSASLAQGVLGGKAVPESVEPLADINRKATVALTRSQADEVRRRAKTTLATRSGLAQKKRVLAMAAAAALASVVLVVLANRPSRPAAVQPPAETVAQVPADLEFPLLPDGWYSGSAVGIHPLKTIPLAIRSDGSNLEFFVGLEGWHPSRAVAKNGSSNGASVASTVRVQSSGYILDFAAEVSGSELVGTFRNVVTGEVGSWRVAKP